MGKIFCLMGKSSSGKDTIYKRLREDASLQLQTIVPYTTRPIREGEQPGREYHFCKEEQVQQFEQEGKIVELRAYDTVHGIWKYFTVDDGQIDLKNEDYILIGTVEAYTKIRDYFGVEQVVPLYIAVDDGVRLQRALHREMQETAPKYAEMCRRFLADEKDFSNENLQKAGIDQIFENEELDACIQKIRKKILENCVK